jgi:hypothetical protein
VQSGWDLDYAYPCLLHQLSLKIINLLQIEAGNNKQMLKVRGEIATIRHYTS